MTKIIQFGYKYVRPEQLEGLPVLDCRVIPNPFQWGVADAVLIERVRTNPEFPKVVERGLQLIAEHGAVYVGCAYGKHRSGAVAQELASRVGGQVSLLF